MKHPASPHEAADPEAVDNRALYPSDDVLGTAWAEVTEVHSGARRDGGLLPGGDARWPYQFGDVADAAVEDLAQGPALGGDPGAGFGELFLQGVSTVGQGGEGGGIIAGAAADAIWVLDPRHEAPYDLRVALAAGAALARVLPRIVPIKPATTLEPRTAKAIVSTVACLLPALVAGATVRMSVTTG